MSNEKTRTEIFASFVGTLINEAPTPDDAMLVSGVCITAWNLAHCDDDTVEAGIDDFVKRIGRSSTSRNGLTISLSQFVNEMVGLKRQAFAEHRFRVTKAQFEMDEQGRTTIVID